MPKFDTDRFRYDGSRPFAIAQSPTKVPDLYRNDTDYELLQRQQADDINQLQNKMYAHNRYGLLTVFQAMDAAGKDGTIQHVFTGANPLGLRVHSFKRPTDEELEHDWLWRSWRVLPERGTIGIFNRSYYEEVLVARVHPEIITQSQRLPDELSCDMKKVFEQRFEAIRNLEKFLSQNGFQTIKFFLHVSKKEQADRLIARIKDPAKNWKFDEGDVNERNFWDDYQQAYQDAINETATAQSPWYVIPADDKKNMRLLVGRVIAKELGRLSFDDAEPNEARFQELQKLISVIEGQ